MKNHKVILKEELNDRLQIESIYQDKIKLIIILRHTCQLSQRKASEVVNLNASSICRYESNNLVMSLEHYTQICFYYKKHIRKNKIIIPYGTLLLIELYTIF